MVNSIMDEEKKAVPGDPASTPHPDSENWERVGAIFDAALPSRQTGVPHGWMKSVAPIWPCAAKSIP